MSNVDKSKTTIKIGCSEINEINQRQGTQLSASGQQLNKGSNSSSSSKQNPTQRSNSSNKTLINSNGVDSSCLNLSSKPETAPTSNVIENKRNECHINEALKPIHNKLSKSVNDVENVGGRKRSKKNSIGDNFEDLNSVFAPKDIDLENGDMDDDEREIEAFKRFCFNSVPLQEKPKVNFDMKSISLKKK